MQKNNYIILYIIKKEATETVNSTNECFSGKHKIKVTTATSFFPCNHRSILPNNFGGCARQLVISNKISPPADPTVLPTFE